MYRILFGLMCTAAAWAQTSPPNPLPNASALAGAILENAAIARRAIGDRNLDLARKSVASARSAARKLIEADTTSARPLLVPFTVEVETTTTYEPVETKRKNGVERTRTTGKTRVRGAERVAERASLDVTLASDRLDKAHEALERGDMAAADTQLSDIETAVVRQSARADVPMLKTRENLMLARSRILENQYKEAAAPLREAARSLAAYLAGPSPANADQVDIVRRRIAELARNIHRRPAHAVDDINIWIDQVRAWDPGAE